MPDKKCDAFDYFDDIAPEFAPEPIRIPCENPAQWGIHMTHPVYDAAGYPTNDPHVTETVLCCDRHLIEAFDDIDDAGFFASIDVTIDGIVPVEA